MKKTEFESLSAMVRKARDYSEQAERFALLATAALYALESELCELDCIAETKARKPIKKAKKRAR